ncbi:hypothetical protein [Streptomyces sp. NPDC001153]
MLLLGTYDAIDAFLVEHFDKSATAVVPARASVMSHIAWSSQEVFEDRRIRSPYDGGGAQLLPRDRTGEDRPVVAQWEARYLPLPRCLRLK